MSRLGYFEQRDLKLLPGGPPPRVWDGGDGSMPLPARPRGGEYFTPTQVGKLPGFKTVACPEGYRGVVTTGFVLDRGGSYTPVKTGRGINMSGLGEASDELRKRGCGCASPFRALVKIAIAAGIGALACRFLGGR